MYKLTKTRIFIVLAICLTGIFFAIPNIVGKSQNLPSWWQPINLGLDLQGGSSLLLEVKLEEVVKERMSSIEDDVRQILRDNKIRYKSLKSTPDSVSVEITNSSSRARAKADFAKMSNELEITENENGIIEIKYQEMALAQLQAKVVDQSIEIVRRRIDEMGTKEPSIQSEGTNRISVQLPGVENPEQIKALLGKTAKLSFHMVDDRTNAIDAKRGKLSNSSRLAKGQMGETYVINRIPVVGGEHLVDASAGFQNGQAIVNFSFNTTGGKKFGEATTKGVGQKLAIVLDNVVISAPSVNTPIIGGSGYIEGNFTAQSANDLALLLRSGALPAPLEVLQERTVGAGLGADSIKAGIVASIIGLIIVTIFMLSAYRLFGVFTLISILLNLSMMLGILSIMGATLTLPGIAGVILTIGMAVDANVLIFERMREEVKNGRSTKDAAEAGFREAWSTIVDSNLTTLVAAFVLLYFGSGPVRGFAVTLTVGIATSMFTSVTVSRIIIASWIKRFKPTKLPI